MDEYRPLENDDLEELEVLAAMKKLCVIRFEAENGGISEIRARITGVYQQDEAHFVRFENGISIRADKLLQVDGKSLKKNC